MGKNGEGGVIPAALRLTRTNVQRERLGILDEGMEREYWTGVEGLHGKGAAEFGEDFTPVEKNSVEVSSVV